MPQISIIIPVYNGEKFIQRCADSIKAQTFTDWECFLVNDGSKDESAARCKAIAQADARFIALDKENGGISDARNFALKRATGKYLMFCDQDDCYAPTCMEEALEKQAADPDSMVHWAYTRDKEEFQKTLSQPQQWDEFRYQEIGWHVTWFTTTVWNRIYDMETVRRENIWFDPKLGWKDSLGEDTDFNEKYIKARWNGRDFAFFEGKQPRYFHFPGNEDAVTNNIAEPKNLNLEEPQPGYCAWVLAEMEKANGSMRQMQVAGAHRDYILHYLRCTAFGVWSAKECKEKLPENFWQDERLKKLLDFAKTERVYSVYYLPFRLRMKGLLARLYNWDAHRSIWYWRFYEGFYRLFFSRWQK